MTAVLSTAQDAFFDVLKTVPLLLLVYALLYYIENRLTDTPALLSRTAQFGPAVSALAGSIPQCGFSAAASALFSAGYLAPATLVAVFLATSDEAVPVMLAGGASAKNILALLIVKFVLAALGGYLLRCTVFRRREVKLDEPLEIELNACGCGEPLPNILGHTRCCSRWISCCSQSARTDSPPSCSAAAFFSRCCAQCSGWCRAAR